MTLQYKNDETVFEEHQSGDVLYLSFRSFDRTGQVLNAFSTRRGGISEGPFASMNLSYTQGDLDENVTENYRRMAYALGIPVESITLSMQTHTTNIRRITEEDKGKGVAGPLDYEDVDGLITNIPGICLSTGYADCVPLYFLDPVHHAIGLSHSGWKGTVGQMGKCTVEAMAEAFGSVPSDLIAGIGPSICQDCYEVSEDVIIQFKEAYEEDAWPQLFYRKENGKYQLDLWEACFQTLIKAGVRKEHISVTNLCTCCNPDILYSNRAVKGGKRGNLAAFLMLL